MVCRGIAWRRSNFTRLPACRNSRSRGPLEESAEFLRLRDGKFWLDVEWLLADEQPDEPGCLLRILAGDPLE